MMRKWLLGLLALILVTPALAQVMRIPRPIVMQPVDRVQQPNDDVPAFDVANDPARARELIERLAREKKELNTKLKDALAMIDQMTTKGGSLVRAYCESPTVSRNTAGASETCARYVCGEVDGLCKKSCSASADCQSGFGCSKGMCKTLAEIQAEG